MSEPENKLPERGQAASRQLDPELFERLIQSQTEEFAVRREENAIKARELELSYEHARRVLDAQVIDREKERHYVEKNNSRGGKLLALIALLITAGIGYALYLNKDQLVIELAKYIGLLLAGGVSGYSIRTIKEKKDDAKK